jgi:hypothetical protein
MHFLLMFGTSVVLKLRRAISTSIAKPMLLEGRARNIDFLVLSQFWMKLVPADRA